MAETWRGIRISIPSHPCYLRPIREMVLEAAISSGWSRKSSEEMTLAMTEGCSNVIRHCYKERTDERIDVVVSFDRKSFRIQIDDYGTFVDPEEIRSRDLEEVRPGGLGVYFMKKVMDEVEYRKNEHGGTTLVLVKYKDSAAGEEGAEEAADV